MPDFKIIQIESRHLPDLKELTPPDWNSNFELFYKTHKDEKYLYPVGVELEDRLVGCGFAIINGNVAWLGNIVVNSNFRNQGLGTKLTSSLVDYCKSVGCKTILLVATKLGEPVYKKLGFKTETEYIFFKGLNNSSLENNYILPIEETDYEAIFNLDFEITKENRILLLKKFLSTGMLYKNNNGEITGFFLPGFGNGFIAAKNETAGLELLKRKHINVESSIVVPVENKAVINFLLENNFKEFLRSPRMFLGEKVIWKPECIYSRAAGYCG